MPFWGVLGLLLRPVRRAMNTAAWTAAKAAHEGWRPATIRRARSISSPPMPCAPHPGAQRGHMQPDSFSRLKPGWSNIGLCGPHRRVSLRSTIGLSIRRSLAADSLSDQGCRSKAFAGFMDLRAITETVLVGVGQGYLVGLPERLHLDPSLHREPPFCSPMRVAQDSSMAASSLH
jgi:hypothetical protein